VDGRPAEQTKQSIRFQKQASRILKVSMLGAAHGSLNIGWLADLLRERKHGMRLFFQEHSAEGLPGKQAGGGTWQREQRVDGRPTCNIQTTIIE
jgi:hypothetical protein